MRKFLVFLILLLSNSLFFAQSGLIKGEKDYYLANTLLIKLKTAPASDAAGNVTLPSDLQRAVTKQGANSAVQKFPSGGNRLNKNAAGLDNIIEVNYSSGEDPQKIAKKVSRLNSVEWAEPRYVRIAAYDVNDPQYNSLTQYNLFKINAAAAWDINRGNKNIIIGIIDTGVFWEHPDLVVNIHQNLAEDADHDGHTIEWDGTKWILDPGDLNGIDDDGNGCIDDLVGWDFGGMNGTPDNNPDEDYAFHGTFVAGVAGAVTNNNLGVASIGFNCSLLPVKCTRKDMDSKYVVYALEGIKYAADNGAQIINCSFAGYSYSKAEQDVINYAVSKGALVIAAAGNNNNSIPNYPASYDGVLSVAASNSSDNRWAASNYGETVDVTAPGQQIYSTWGTDSYSSMNGTSFAAPLTAGLTGLVKSQFPSYTPLQIAEQIRVTSDDIYSLNADSLKNKLGKGRINAFKALSTNDAVSVRGESIVFKDEGNNNGVIESGERGSIEINFVNYLSSVPGVQVNLSTSSPYVSVENGTFNTGALTTLGTIKNSYNKFYFFVKNNTPNNEKISFLLTYSGSGYNDFQWITVTVNPSFGIMAGNNISLSVSGSGNIGYADYPNNTQGQGLRYMNGESLLYEGSFLYGTSASKLVDAARIENYTRNLDFQSTAPFIKKSSSLYSDLEGTASFNDNNAGANKLGIETKIVAYQYAQAPYNNFIILRTVLFNKTSADITNLYAGWFLDVDLDATDYDDDVVAYDQQGQFMYVYDSNQSPYSYYLGAALLTSQNAHSFAIDNFSDNNGLSITPSFSKLTKWNILSGNVSKTSAGPGDISFLVSSGPMDIKANSFKNVSYVIAVGLSLNDLKSSITNSRTKYSLIPDDSAPEQKEIPNEYNLSQNFPNPFLSFTKIYYDLPKEDYVKIRVFDAIGREVALLTEGVISAGRHFVLFNGNLFPSGVYFYQIETSSYYCAKKMVLIK